jgi:hypothetical protein
VLGLAEPAAERRLERLCDLGVLVPAAGGGDGGRDVSYLLPRPLRLYARERAHAEEPDELRRAALARLAAAYQPARIALDHLAG